MTKSLHFGNFVAFWKLLEVLILYLGMVFGFELAVLPFDVGFVISGRRIITNAHVVADHSFVLVRKHGSPIKHRAKVQAVGHECDLAILVIDSEVFWEGMNPLELGDIPLLQGEVSVVGYPQGTFFDDKILKHFLHT